MVRRWFYVVSVLLLVLAGGFAWLWTPAAWSFVVILPLAAVGLHDSLQRRHTVLRNFPLIGHVRYALEAIRPEIQQYFIESNIDAFPIEREFRSLAYQRAKGELETLPYGTQRDVYRIGYEWASHAMDAREPPAQVPRVTVGGPACSRPYSASLLNISAMSYGALSKNAVLALNRGAAEGEFAHNSGEGGLSSYHLDPGGDLIWQIGTAYFGCRTADGAFDPEAFAAGARHDSVKMIELKLSQGAKPGHGGILPGRKVTAEIARIRGVPTGETCFSPPRHHAFDTPLEMMHFIDHLRSLADGKPVGIKLCIGRPGDFFAICKAMLETGITPDFVTVDGGEGATGAAPLEFSNSLGMPARDAWMFAASALTGIGVRGRVKVIASGKVLTGFHMIRALALGADLCATARGMMLALGCIQSLRCHTNRCPTGITTQDPALMYGLNVEEKYKRVARFHAGTVRGCLELMGAMGLTDPAEIRPCHVYRRVDDMRVRHLGELYDFLEPGQLLDGNDLPAYLAGPWQASRPDRWDAGARAGVAATAAGQVSSRDGSRSSA